MVRPLRPRVTQPQVYGSVKDGNFWVEYPSGLIDTTRANFNTSSLGHADEPAKVEDQLDISVEGDRVIRINTRQTAFVVIDMQNFFLHPELRDHPTGLACVQPVIDTANALRQKGGRVVWLNWGLTPTEVTTLPPALARSFTKNVSGGFGSDMGGNWGPLLVRGSLNAQLYGPLQDEWLKGKDCGSDIWIHKNRMGGLWGSGTFLDLYLKEEGIKTLFFAGVNTDQCVLGTLVDAYFNGYDVIIVKDATATGSPEGGLSNVLYNGEGAYGFVTDSRRICEGAQSL